MFLINVITFVVVLVLQHSMADLFKLRVSLVHFTTTDNKLKSHNTDGELMFKNLSGFSYRFCVKSCTRPILKLCAVGNFHPQIGDRGKQLVDNSIAVRGPFIRFQIIIQSAQPL